MRRRARFPRKPAIQPFERRTRRSNHLVSEFIGGLRMSWPGDRDSPAMGNSVELKKLRLRYPGTCVACGSALPKGAEAMYHPASKTVRCLECPVAAGASESPWTAVDTERFMPPVRREQIRLAREARARATDERRYWTPQGVSIGQATRSSLWTNPRKHVTIAAQPPTSVLLKHRPSTPAPQEHRRSASTIAAPPIARRG